MENKEPELKQLNLLDLHPDIVMRKEKIYSTTDFKLRKTKIICTLGPSSYKAEDILAMLDAGMEIARLNFSHGDHNVIFSLIIVTQEAN
jgi:hypothetical protein